MPRVAILGKKIRVNERSAASLENFVVGSLRSPRRTSLIKSWATSPHRDLDPRPDTSPRPLGAARWPRLHPASSQVCFIQDSRLQCPASSDVAPGRPGFVTGCHRFKASECRGRAVVVANGPSKSWSSRRAWQAGAKEPYNWSKTWSAAVAVGSCHVATFCWANAPAN